MGKPWEYEPRRPEQLQARAAFRRKAATNAFTRLASNSLRDRGIDPSILTPSRALEDNQPGTQNEQFQRTVKRLTGMGMSPDDAVKQVRRYLDVTSRRVSAGMVSPRTIPQPGLDAFQQQATQPPIPFRTVFDDKTEEAIQQFRSDLTTEGYAPWMIDAQLRGQFRLAELLEETKTSFPVRTPPGTTIESLALDRLETEMGDLLKKAQPKPSKSMFDQVVAAASKGAQLTFFGSPTGGEKILEGVGEGIELLEKDPLLGGPFARTPREGFPHFDPEGETPFERGAEISRPVVQKGQEILGEPFEQVEKAGIPVVSPAAGGITDAIRSEIVEDIGTELINPAALVFLVPFALQGIEGLRGATLAFQIADNLIGTGVTRAALRGTMRGLTILGREGLAGVSKLSRVVRETPAIQRAITTLQGEAGALRLGGTPRQKAILLAKDALDAMPKRMLDDVASRIGATAGRTKAQTITNIRKVQAAEAPGTRKVLAQAAREMDAAREKGVLQAVKPTRPERVGRVKPDIVEQGLEQRAAKEARAEEASRRRSIEQAVKPAKPQPTPSLKPHERDATGAALERLSEAPDNPVPIRSRRDLPELSQFDDQLESALRFRDDARETLKFNRSAVKAGILSPTRVDEATLQLARANEQLKSARAILREAKIRATRDSVMKLVRSVGGSDESAGIIGRAFDNSVALVPQSDSLLTAGAWRQHIAKGIALVKGRVFRGVGVLADQRLALVEALHLQTADEMDDIFRGVQRLLSKELDNLTFTGPNKWAELAQGEYKAYHVVQHPDWFAGKSAKLDGLLIDAQLGMRARLEQARALGYPIEALDGAYLEQLWDIPRGALEQPILRGKGKISVAKQRWFDDYLEGLSKGGKPLDLTVEELMQHSSRLLDEAIGDAFMRQEVLRRYGTRTAKVPALTGSRKFGNPLYQGWSAPQDVTAAIDRLYQPVGTGSRMVGDVAATMKNTAFGLVDIAIGGVQFPLSMAHGGFQIGVGTLNRSLQGLGLPYIHVAMQDPAVVGRLVQYAEDTLHIGIAASS
ncbi:hypothetical protein LCGC14_1075320, partial [marine sediment metagenome]